MEIYEKLKLQEKIVSCLKKMSPHKQGISRIYFRTPQCRHIDHCCDAGLKRMCKLNSNKFSISLWPNPTPAEISAEGALYEQRNYRSIAYFITL